MRGELLFRALIISNIGVAGCTKDTEPTFASKNSRPATSRSLGASNTFHTIMTDAEQQPLLANPRKPENRSLAARWKSHMVAEVSRDWADIVLILCYLITGLLDSASISVWGSFVSMQTGNTVYIGLGLAAPR